MQNKNGEGLKIRRALLSVSDKEGIVELARTLESAGVELVATGRTASLLQSAGLKIVPIEAISGSPEAFQGRMKTLSFPVCSGILFRRGDQKDEKDLDTLKIQPIDCVVVNFYPFEEACIKPGISRQELIEEIDIGGPTLVRAAAKNSPDVLVLTSPKQYSAVIREIQEWGCVKKSTAEACANTAWEKVLSYDTAIARELGTQGRRTLRYGENPHQRGFLEFDPEGPIVWSEPLTPTELSYNNIMDLSAGYALASDLAELAPHSSGVVIIKHNNPCGVALVPKSTPSAQKLALRHAWEGDPVSAFGGVIVFTDPLEEEVAAWLCENFVEAVAAPQLTKTCTPLQLLMGKRRNLKAVQIRRLGEMPPETMVVVPGGKLYQTSDLSLREELNSVTQVKWPKEKNLLAKFGIAVCRALKSNAIALVREIPSAGSGSSSGTSSSSVGAGGNILQLVGAGQGQPNRVEALKALAVPRAQSVLKATQGRIEDCLMVSDAFFPFRDTVDTAYASGIRFMIQPGGSIKDKESIDACNEHGIAMAFTGVRHFRH